MYGRAKSRAVSLGGWHPLAAYSTVSAATIVLPTSSMSRAFRAGNGRFMSKSERSGSWPSTRTSKHPFRGFSGLIATLTEGAAAFPAASTLDALVLNAPQLLHASITRVLEALAGGAVAFARLALGSSVGSSVFFVRLGGMLFSAASVLGSGSGLARVRICADQVVRT